MLPAKIVHGFSDVRRDFEACDQGRLRGGILIALVTAAVVASGWPPGDGLQRGMFLVMGALPLTAIGAGLAVGEFMHARADRRGQDVADEREFEILRARIAVETGRAAPGCEVVPESPTRSERPARPRPLMENAGPLVTRKRSTGCFRSGHLRLR